MPSTWNLFHLESGTLVSLAGSFSLSSSPIIFREPSKSGSYLQSCDFAGECNLANNVINYAALFLGVWFIIKSQLHRFSSSSDSNSSLSSGLFACPSRHLHISTASSPESIRNCLIAPVSLLVWRLAVWGGSGAVCRPVSASAAPLQQQHGHYPEPSLCHPLPPHEIQFWSHQCKSSDHLGDPESIEKVNAKRWLRKCLQDCNLLLPMQRKQLSMQRDSSLCLNLHPKMNIKTKEGSGFHMGISIKMNE